MESYLSVAEKYQRIAQELEKASGHSLVAARHYREADVPRGCAHGLASYGHMQVAQQLLSQLAMLHAEKAQLD